MCEAQLYMVKLSWIVFRDNVFLCKCRYFTGVARKRPGWMVGEQSTDGDTRGQDSHPLPSVVMVRQQRHFNKIYLKPRFFHILSVLNQDNDLSPPLTKCCECLKISIKKCNNVVVTKSSYYVARSNILAENVVREHFTDMLSTNILAPARCFN